MNLFQDEGLIQAVRDHYGLSLQGARLCLAAYQLGSLSRTSALIITGTNTTQLSGAGYLREPVNKGILNEIGRARVQPGSRPVAVYTLADRDTFEKAVKEGGYRNQDLFEQLNALEQEGHNYMKEFGNGHQ